MKHKSSFLYIGSFALLGSAEYTVPAYIDKQGNWVVNVTLPLSNESMSIRMAWLSQDRIPFELTSRGIDDLNVTLGSGESAAAPQDLSFSYVSRPITICTPAEQIFEYSSLGVSPNSPLVRAAGSVAMIRSPLEGHENQGHIVIESTFSSFNSTCVPGSLMRLPAFDLGRSNFTLKVGESVETLRRIYMDNHRTIFSSVPQQILDEIRRYLVYFGARPVWGSSEFSNCTRESIALVPPIELIGTEFGTLAFYPDEFVILYPNNRCRIIPQGNPAMISPPTFTFSVLKVTGVNVRISSNGTVEFCDAAANDEAGHADNESPIHG